MNILSYIPFLNKGKLRLYALLRRILTKYNFKIGKMILPDGREIPLVYSEKPMSIFDDIEDVHVKGETKGSVRNDL